MKHNLNHLSLAVRLALSVGIFAAAGAVQAQESTTSDAPAAKQVTPAPAAKSKAKNLEAVVVTGSLIRRVDAETSSPVVTVDRAAITNAGSPTLGNVLQQLPSISGNATNTQNNSNGGGVASPLLEGGDGAARVSLRGLGTNRTLMLIDGQRMANSDLNMIPQNMIERVDVLAEGASTVYGSDAIGGVVNFILRKDYKGAEASVNVGESDHGDGHRHGISLTAGASGDNYNIVGGMDYNKYDAVLATQRKYSAHQLYLSSGVISPAGSSTLPTGKIQTPASIAAKAAGTCPTQYITLAQGNGSSVSDYRCDRGNPDAYNYNAFNYIQTAQRRFNTFVLGNYKLADNLTFFADAFLNHTQSSGQDAPAPTSANSDGWYVLASNPINPFGVTFGTDPAHPGAPGTGYGFNTRLTGLGTRLHTYTTSNVQINTGLRGTFGQSTWSWDATLNYGHANRVQRDYNEVNIADFQAAINSGVNIFDQAHQTAALKAGVDTPKYVFTNATKQVQIDANGELWDLPAGAVQLAVGALYRHQSMNYTVSPDAVLNLATGGCQILQEACGSPGRGADHVKEVYAESLIPLLSQQPWAYSLNLDVGIRASKYGSSGNTNNKKIAIEWRPIEDLLLRGTISEVFRAPNLDELYDGVTLVQPNLNDPCVGLTAAQLAQHPAACQYVPVNWAGNSPAQVNTYYAGAKTVGASLKPEQGKSIDFGLVYNPSWADGLSTSVDFWHIYLSDLLTPIQASTVVNACFANNSSPYCSFINRYTTTTQQPGQVNVINTPVVNLGNLSTTGIDFTLNYKIPHFDLGSVDPGNFKAGLSTTYLSSYKNNATPGQAGAQTVNYAGTYSQQFGNISRWRGTGTLNWAKGNWSAQWQTRYIHHLTNLNADASFSGVNIPMASVLYHSIQVGYAIPEWHTRIDLGVDNLSNKAPPLVYQNGLNYNVDTATYDALGRYYWMRATFKF
ncbi:MULTISPECIES: TonB-dependent receptor plug domain-containing protein [Rhodanobacter]|uniref:TonB-dependent receptor plug domain-containing protein n=1 Tax=Rhodanobacter TaxID=75309 RepID=UPI00040EFD39|nr:MULTISPECIES: TonB-dependent receptor [Rhodanobacter]TAN17023.1 MAG: TonB-dependent receptor [Rhodanobacter sp.]UJJ54759.1 TonB-dependent receptor [Rhodanobacter thiooxydans]